ncbi:hypothetical protein BRC85_06150 [Halobacteriales archaeon QS_1_69_70]|nr:MAG: hypothetical protein BRC85_06150 [Halobacteriales archaeon QS_1_69_70]
MTAAAVAVLAAPIAATAGSITADPAEADADSTHTVRAAVGPDLDDSSLSGLDVDYQATDRNGDVSNVDESDVETMYIDRADGGATDVTDDVNGVSASNNGETLNVRLGGSYVLHEGDHVVISYSDATNPSAGEYEIVFVVNPQSDGTRSTGTLSIAEDGSSTTPTDDGETATATDDGETTTPTDETPTDTDDGETATPTDSEEDTATPTEDDAEPSGAQTGTDRDGDPTDAPDTDDDGQDAGTATQATTNGTQSTDVGEDSPGNETGAGDAAEGTDDDGAGPGLVVAAVAFLAAALLARR